jgi:hypothetical protein
MFSCSCVFYEMLNIKLYAVSTGRAVLVSGRLHLYAKVFVTTPLVESICNDVILATINKFTSENIFIKIFWYFSDIPKFHVYLQ